MWRYTQWSPSAPGVRRPAPRPLRRPPKDATVSSLWRRRMAIPQHYDWILHHAARRPEKIAAIDLAGNHRWSYRDLNTRTSKLSGYLRDACSVGPRDRVAVLAQNS